MNRVHTQVDLRQIPEAVNSKAGAREQRKRQGKLANHQNAPKLLARRARAGAAAFLERLAGIDTRRIPRRRTAKEHSSKSQKRQRRKAAPED